MITKIMTIGVYGFCESSFFQAIDDAGVDTFLDIRMRRGMRGATYSFANSQRLQKRLQEMGVHYIHVKELAPSNSIREKQKKQDKDVGETKRSRKKLGLAFIQTYKTECLDTFNFHQLIEDLGEKAKIIALFCVEKEPEACHRSLVAMYLSKKLGLIVEDIIL